MVLGIVNHEYQPTSYRAEIRINGVSSEELCTGVLAHEEKWQQEVSFTLNKAGLNQKMEFWLYKDDESQPCFENPLYLHVDVY